MGSRVTRIITSKMIPWRDGWYRCTYNVISLTMTTMSIFSVASATSSREESNTLTTTNVYVVGALIEEGTFVSSFIPTGDSALNRDADDFDEVNTPFHNMSDALGSGITISHIIGDPLSGADSAAMSMLNIEGPAGLNKDWEAELFFTT